MNNSAEDDEWNIGIDTRFALLIVIEALLQKITYEKIEKALLAQVVKNISLRRWYPEARELPKKDPEHFRRINPWIDEIFKADLPELEAMELLEVNGRLKLTQIGRSFAATLLRSPKYSKFKDEVFELVKDCKEEQGTFSTSNFYNFLIRDSKKLYQDEVTIYDGIIIHEKFPIEIAIEPDKITSYFDAKQWLSTITERIKNLMNSKEVSRAPYNKTQLQFVNEICKRYEDAPSKDKPIVEICGLCIDVKGSTWHGMPQTEFSILVEGQGIFIFARGLQVMKSNVDYHGFRVIGIPSFHRGFIRIEALRIYDRGKYIPTDKRAL